MKKIYGIYLAYPPTIDLRDQGLGRHLAAFLNGAIESKGAHFIIVCPSWSKKSILALMKAESVPESSFQIIAPAKPIISLQLFDWYQQIISRLKPKKEKTKKVTFLDRFKKTNFYFRKKILTATNILQFLLLGVPVLISFLVISIFSAVDKIVRFLNESFFKQGYIKKSWFFKRIIRPILGIIRSPKDSFTVTGWFKVIEQQETDLMLKLIEGMTEVRAWYSPTAFWPSFNQISRPHLMCVPDVVLTEFPIGFANVGGNRFLDTFKTIEHAIEGGTHFVTYSDHVKKTILVKRYKRKEKHVRVIPHAANTLHQIIEQQAMSSKEIENAYQQHFSNALTKSSLQENGGTAANADLKFIFYASQFRPSKNVITLLRAYQYLLRERFVTHKLILTGKPKVMEEIDQFIIDNQLGHEVLLLSGLSVAELAACYKLADLAVNPSLSEGGCPFTFTEALSVGTPVVMADIPVTTEIINDPGLQQQMLFDPYSWKSLADRIEWALTNRDKLLKQQVHFFDKLAQRTWKDVVNDYINELDRISESVNVEASGQVI
ncbi:glycosyltransferase [Legionella birminghamensis]|nr:glycosyltransferase [Legionella birminghamensis]